MSTGTSTRSTHVAAGLRSGWETFTAILLTIGGVANALWGWGVLRNAADWGENRPYVDAAFIGQLELWGWVSLVWAALLLVGAVLMFTDQPAGPTMAIVLASVSALFWILVLPAFPLLALAAMALDILVIYGLTVPARRAA